jgi:hypothetical protein
LTGSLSRIDLQPLAGALLPAKAFERDSNRNKIMTSMNNKLVQSPINRRCYRCLACPDPLTGSRGVAQACCDEQVLIVGYR